MGGRPGGTRPPVRDPRRGAAPAVAAFAAVLLMGSCSSSPATPSATVIRTGDPIETPAVTPAGQSAPAPATTAPDATASPPPAPPDLTARPLTWLAPLPPLSTGPGREFTGSPDFMTLFGAGADWGKAAGIGVFKLYGEWVAYAATDAQLAEVVRSLRETGHALAVEMGPLEPDGCGQGVEGFPGLDEARRIGDRIAAAGGRIDLVAMDEPWFYGHVYDGPEACRWSLDRIADGVLAFEAVMRERFPDVIVGDTEALPRDLDPDRLLAWLDAYGARAGHSLPFVHLDLDFGRPDWPSMVHRLDADAGRRGTDVGVIFFGDPSDPDDSAWFGTLAQRLTALAADGAGRPPDHLLFQSWQDRPDRVLPADDASTWTGFVSRYLADPAELSGIADLLPPANLALGADVRASSALPEAGPRMAVDGDPGTNWNSGAGPPAWIEIDLGRAREIAMVRLRVTQYPEGRTIHRLLARGPATGGGWEELEVFRGTTADALALEWRPRVALTGIRMLRVETAVSPSWVAWREIEVFAPSR